MKYLTSENLSASVIDKMQNACLDLRMRR